MHPKLFMDWCGVLDGACLGTAARLQSPAFKEIDVFRDPMLLGGLGWVAEWVI